MNPDEKIGIKLLQISCDVNPKQIPVGQEVSITITYNNQYGTSKTCKLILYECADASGTNCTPISETNTFELPAGEGTIQATLRVEKSGYYGIGLFNVTDNKLECGQVIQALGMFEQIMQLMPMMLGLVMAILPISLIPKIFKVTEEVTK